MAKDSTSTAFPDEGAFSSDPSGAFNVEGEGFAAGSGPTIKIQLPKPITPPAHPKKLSDIVQPWTVVQSRLPDPPRAEPEAFPGEAGPASLTWGAASDFNTDPAPTQPIEDAPADDRVAPGFGVKIQEEKKSKSKKNKPQENKPGVETWHMIDFKGEKGKIYSPDDKDVWVEMIRVTTVRFRGDGGKIRIDHYKWPAWPKPPP